MSFGHPTYCQFATILFRQCLRHSIYLRKITMSLETAINMLISQFKLLNSLSLFQTRGERERLFGSREREGKLKIPFPFYGKGTGIRKCYEKGREEKFEARNTGNHIKSKVKFKILFIFMENCKK